jgi:hypothetical protein
MYLNRNCGKFHTGKRLSGSEKDAMVIAFHLCVTIRHNCHVFNILTMLILSLCLLKSAMNAHKQIFRAFFTSTLDKRELQSYYEPLIHQEHGFLHVQHTYNLQLVFSVKG